MRSMKSILTCFVLLCILYAPAQEVKDLQKLPVIPYGPRVNGVDYQNRISIASIHKNGLRIGLADNSFRVVLFDVVYDCHSKSLTDFSMKRYLGDSVPPGDDYLQKRILAGDLIDIVNTVVEKQGICYLMKPFSFVVTP